MHGMSKSIVCVTMNISFLCSITGDMTVISPTHTFMQWLPFQWKWQWPYLLYRWVIALYFLGWLLHNIIEAGRTPDVQGKYLIYLTNWGFLCFNLYLLVSALSVTVTLYHYHTVAPLPTITPLTISAQNRRIICTPLSIMNGLHWATALVGLQYSVAITILFWVFFNDPSDQELTLSISSIHVHMLNGIIGFLDTWITGVPFRILHFVYGVMFGSAYVVFSGLYFAGGGTDVENKHYIYPVLDYGNNPGLAAGVAVGCGLVFTIALHFTFYFMFLVRYWVSRMVQVWLYGCMVEEVENINSPNEYSILTMHEEKTKP